MTKEERKAVVYLDLGDEEEIEITLGDIEDALLEYGYIISKVHRVIQKA
jgi:hypothetical protein